MPSRIAESRATRAAPAVTDDADPAGRLDRLGGAGDIFERTFETDLADQCATALETVVVVAEFDAGFDMIEKRRRNRGVAECCELVGDTADVRIHPENFLHDDDAALGRAFGLGHVSADALHAGRVEVDVLAHDDASAVN